MLGVRAGRALTHPVGPLEQCALPWARSTAKWCVLTHQRGDGHMALTTGSQLRAARAITRMDQGLLAEKARVGVNTIRRLEAVDGELRATLATVRKLEQALEAAGVELL